MIIEIQKIDGLYTLIVKEKGTFARVLSSTILNKETQKQIKKAMQLK